MTNGFAGFGAFLRRIGAGGSLTDSAGGAEGEALLMVAMVWKFGGGAKLCGVRAASWNGIVGNGCAGVLQ